MVRIPSSVERSDATATKDENSDGVVDQRDDRIAADAQAVQAREQAVQDPEQKDERFGRWRRTRESAPVVADPLTEERAVDSDDARTEVPVAVGPRPRASFFATLGLIFGVAAVLVVLTGVLAPLGFALGVLGAIFSIGGLSATSRRHVAGRFDALVGLGLSLVAVVIGILVMSDSLGWLSTDTDTVPQFRDWLRTQWDALTRG